MSRLIKSAISPFFIKKKGKAFELRSGAPQAPILDQIAQSLSPGAGPFFLNPRAFFFRERKRGF